MSAPTKDPVASRLSADDLVPDEPLGGPTGRPISEADDLLHHRVIARKVAEVATSSNGKVNIALFGPWGAGKSSFNGLLAEELAVMAPDTRHITFDAWKSAGEGFRTNFLSELAGQIPRADRNISNQLFQTTTKVTFPLAGNLVAGKGRRWRILAMVGAVLGILFVLLPWLWTLIQNLLEPVTNFGNAMLANMQAWAGFAAGSTLLLVVIVGLIELSKVTVTRSTPSHVAQFSSLFDKLLATDRKRRFVVFIDELDRCGEEDVMTTLEGLRTFLGHERCVFALGGASRGPLSGPTVTDIPGAQARVYGVAYGELHERQLRMQSPGHLSCPQVKVASADQVAARRSDVRRHPSGTEQYLEGVLTSHTRERIVEVTSAGLGPA